MTRIILLGILTFGMNALACPDISGEWTCEDSQGEKWTETVKKDGVKYSITIDGDTDDIYANGRIQKDSSGSLDFVSTALTSLGEAGASMLPTAAQGLIFMQAVKSAAETTKTIIKSEGFFVCDGNSIKGSLKFTGGIKIPYVLSIAVDGTADVIDTLNGSERSSKIVVKGIGKGKPAMSLMGGEQTSALDETTTSKCVRK